MEGHKIKDIENGTVVDHIPAGKVLKVLDALRMGTSSALIAMNVTSNRMGRKDILKLENIFLTLDQIEKIATVAPSATVNTIRDFKVVGKKKAR